MFVYGYIYLTTNTVAGKIYIGQHIATKYEPDKYVGSGLILLRAIEKQGKANFSNKLLCECFSREELNQKEIEYIKLYNSTDQNIGYNISSGGDINNVSTIIITNDIEEKHILPCYLDY